MIRRNLMGAAAILALAGCGGSDGNGSPAGPTPTPSATPTPVPTPSPTPTPISYQKVTDITRDFSFPGLGARIVDTGNPFTSPGPFLIDTNDDRNAVKISHTGQTDNYRATYGADTIEGIPTRETVEGLARARYAGTNNDEYQIASFSTGAEYSQLLTFTKESRSTGAVQYVFPVFFFGAETLGADLPAQGAVTYTAVTTCDTRRDESVLCPSSGMLARMPSASGTISADWSAGTVKATAEVRRALLGGSREYRIAVDGTVDRATGRIRGTVSVGNGGEGYTGSVLGQFYGPQAKEVGIIVLLREPSSNQILFLAIGGRS